MTDEAVSSTRLDLTHSYKENSPGFGSFILTVTEGEDNSENSSNFAVPVFKLEGDFTPQQRSEKIFNYIQEQRQLNLPVIAWREGSTGPCSFLINAEAIYNPVLSLIKVTKKRVRREYHPYTNYLSIPQTKIDTETTTVAVKPNQLLNIHWLDSPVDQQIGKTLTTKATVSGQTPAGLPLKAVVSFQPSQK